MPVLESDVYETKSSRVRRRLAKNRLASCLKRWMPQRERCLHHYGQLSALCLVGGLMSTRAMHLKAAGAVLDGSPVTLLKFLN